MHPRQLSHEDWNLLTKILNPYIEDFTYTKREYERILVYYKSKLDVILPPDGEIDFCRPVHSALEDIFAIPFNRIPLFLGEYLERDTVVEQAVLKFRLEVGK